MPGLDSVLNGGLLRGRIYLVEGVPGSGKTTFAMQFLLEGRAQGEPVLYVTLSESGDELREGAASHGWSLDGIGVRELAAADETLTAVEQYTMFHPSEIELGQTFANLLADVDAQRPTRVVIDSLSELRLLAGNPLRYRRHVLALKQFLAQRKATVLMLDDLTAVDRDLQVQSLAHGAILLENLSPEFGTDRRRLRIVKYRGSDFRGGYHDFVIRRAGLEVFPRVVAAETRQPHESIPFPSGISELDMLMGGGVEAGTSTLIVGAAGTGKSSLAAQFVTSLAAGEGRATMFIFDESISTLLSRTRGLGIDLETHVQTGRVQIRQVDPAELSPGEFAGAVRNAAEQGARIIVIDSLNGYLNAMPEERFLVTQLHEMLTDLGNRGVATILIGAHSGLIGAQMQTPVDATYLADAVVLLRYFESKGEVKQAISILKKRGGAHERSIREYRLTSEGITVGPPLREFRGILTGVPVPVGIDPQEKSSQ